MLELSVYAHKVNTFCLLNRLDYISSTSCFTPTVQLFLPHTQNHDQRVCVITRFSGLTKCSECSKSTSSRHLPLPSAPGFTFLRHPEFGNVQSKQAQHTIQFRSDRFNPVQCITPDCPIRNRWDGRTRHAAAGLTIVVW